MESKYRREELCGDPEWQTPHLYTLRNAAGGGLERRCAYCHARDPAEKRAIAQQVGVAAAVMVLCTVLPQIAAQLARIATALEGFRLQE